jgi:hypothetical protein
MINTSPHELLLQLYSAIFFFSSVTCKVAATLPFRFLDQEASTAAATAVVQETADRTSIRSIIFVIDCCGQNRTSVDSGSFVARAYWLHPTCCTLQWAETETNSFNFVDLALKYFMVLFICQVQCFRLHAFCTCLLLPIKAF